MVLTPGNPDQTDTDRAAPDLPTGESALSLQDRIDLALPDEISLRLGPYSGPAGLSVQATSDPTHRFDLDTLASLVAEWQPHQSDADGLPVIQIGPEGFRVQVRHAIRRADQMESFIDFALNLIRVI